MIRVAIMFGLGTTYLVFSQQARAEDNFIVLEPYEICIGANVPGQLGVVANSCDSNVSIYNGANGSIYFCTAEWQFNTKGSEYTLRSKHASCHLTHAGAANNGGSFSVGSKNDPRKIQLQNNSGTIPSTSYWITSRNALQVEACFDVPMGITSVPSDFCIPAPLQP